MKPMWVVVQLDDFTFRRAVYDKVNLIVQEMSGETVKAGSLCDLVVLARFPHRKYRTVEKAVAVALNTLPVKRTTVMAQDPFVLREKTFGLTKELFERQDEVLGV